MSRTTPEILHLAERLIEYETRGRKKTDGDFPAVFHVCEKLRPQLAMLMGKAGFRAVLARALAISRAEVPWLAAIQVNGDGSLDGWDKPEAMVGPVKIAEGGMLVVAQVLGLLVAFIGENLTLRLVREVWPKLPIEI